MLIAMSQYSPGFCSLCRVWLGTLHQEPESNVKTADVDNLEFELWAAENIGSIIAASPTLPAAPSRQNVIDSIRRFHDSLLEDNSTLVARLLNVPNTTARLWLQGRAIPPLKALARVSFLTKIPLLKMLTTPVDAPTHLTQSRLVVSEHQLSHIYRRSILAKQKVREQMESALTETPPPSLDEVASRLGYQSRTTLHVKFPELSKKINANYRASERFISNRQSRRAVSVKPLDAESQRKALESELTKPCPATLIDLGSRLGYSHNSSFKKRWPNLARALVEKRREYQKQQLTKRKGDCRRILEAALDENPPPSLKAFAKKIEGWSISSLKEYFPLECHRISARHAEYRKQRLQRAGERLKQSLIETPQISLNRLSKELGHRRATLELNYPELCRSITDRYNRHRDELRKKRMIVCDPSVGRFGTT
jgi:hypothetical protein